MNAGKACASIFWTERKQEWKHVKVNAKKKPPAWESRVLTTMPFTTTSAIRHNALPHGVQIQSSARIKLTRSATICALVRSDKEKIAPYYQKKHSNNMLTNAMHTLAWWIGIIANSMASWIA